MQNLPILGLHQKGGFLNIFTTVWRLAFSGNALPIYEVIFFLPSTLELSLLKAKVLF